MRNIDIGIIVLGILFSFVLVGYMGYLRYLVKEHIIIKKIKKDMLELVPDKKDKIEEIFKNYNID